AEDGIRCGHVTGVQTCALPIYSQPRLACRSIRFSFDPQVFLDTAGMARKVAEFRRNESIYTQGEAANSVMYVQRGGVKFSVVNGSGREAVVAMFGRSEEHTSELQSRGHLVCRLLL